MGKHGLKNYVIIMIQCQKFDLFWDGEANLLFCSWAERIPNQNKITKKKRRVQNNDF